jgi:adenylosuccinate lyase
LAEPIQTVMRRHGVANPYEQLEGADARQGWYDARHCMNDGLAIPRRKGRLKTLTRQLTAWRPNWPGDLPV